MKLFNKSRQIAFVSYTLPFCYVQDTLDSNPASFVIKGEAGWQIWV